MNNKDLQSLRFKEIRKHFGDTQNVFADKLDMMASYVSQIEAGKRGVSTGVLDKLSSAFAVNTDWLISGRGSMFKDLSNINNSQSDNNIILLDMKVVAGEIGETDLSGMEISRFSMPNLKGEGYYALYIDGDSMTPTYNHGDLVIVKKIDLHDFKSDDAYLVNVVGSRPLLKRVRFVGNHTYQLISDNKAIDPYNVHGSDIAGFFKIYYVVKPQ